MADTPQAATNRLKAKKCPACGAKIYLIRRQESGKVIPAQAITKVMAIQPDLAGGEDRLVDVNNARSDAPLYISHFQTCPHPERFSRKATTAERNQRRTT